MEIEQNIHFEAFRFMPNKTKAFPVKTGKLFGSQPLAQLQKDLKWCEESRISQHIFLIGL